MAKGPKGYGKRREVIRRRLQAGDAPGDIARDLGVARSTVYRTRTSSMVRKGDRAGYLTVSARVSDREIVALDRFTGKGGMRSRGAVMRRLIRVLGDFFVPAPEEEAFLQEADLHLRNLGGNFNQIASALSRSMLKVGRADPSREQINAINAAAREVAEIRTVIRTMLVNHQVKAQELTERMAERSAMEGEDA